MKPQLPRLRKAGDGWYCIGNGLTIHARTPKVAYDHWEFATMTGYHYQHERERERKAQEQMVAHLNDDKARWDAHQTASLLPIFIGG